MNLPKIIQGGMGVAISHWKLAQAVSMQGHLGVVSGTAMAIVLAARLSDGDLDGSQRRALSHFPFQEPVQRILDRYYVPGGKATDAPYKRPPMFNMKPSKHLNELTIIANFVEVFLAKEGHNNPVGVNLLEKVQLPNTSSLYGAMLADVDFVIMGAGIPFQIPGILDDLSTHQPTTYRLDIVGETTEDRLHFDPEAVFPGIAERVGDLKRPNFLPIVSSVVLAMALLKRSTGKINGFVVEMPTAGGHNAPPRGAMQLNDLGEPIYGKKDEVRFDKIKDIGLPFWLAGEFGTPEGLQRALDVGATGIQVGTAFAYCNESGMEAQTRQEIIQQVLAGDISVRTDPLVSPTGFPFKVVQHKGTIADPSLYEERNRICDLGYLRELYADEGKVRYRCASEPVEDYVKKGGKEEDTLGRGCICNNLGGAAGFPQVRKDGYVEPAIITSGDTLPTIGQFVPPGETSYSAKDVIEVFMPVLQQGEPIT